MCANEKQGLHRLPDPKVLAGSNYCDVGFRRDDHGKRLVVLAAIDNLVKGAAGSAVQSLNISRGFDEHAGLDCQRAQPILERRTPGRVRLRCERRVGETRDGGRDQPTGGRGRSNRERFVSLHGVREADSCRTCIQ